MKWRRALTQLMMMKRYRPFLEWLRAIYQDAVDVVFY